MDQSANNKRIAKNTLLLYFRMLLTMAVSLYTSRVVLNTLGIDDYGIYNVVGGIVTMFGFLNSAMAGATQRFLTFELGRGNKEKLNKTFCTSMTIHVVISLIILLLAETIGLWFLNHKMVIPLDRMTAAHWVYQMSVLSTMVMMISVPYNATIIAHEKMSAFAYISILEVVLRLVIVYMLLMFDSDKLIIYAVLLCCVQLLIRVIYGRYCNKHFDECHYEITYDKELFNEMAAFAGWSLFGNLAAVGFTQGVNIILNMFFGPVVNAARAIAVQVQHAVQGFVQNFQMALNPQITKSYANNDLNQMHTLVFASSKYSFFLLLCIALPIIIETEPILKAWLKTVPDYTVDFVRLILLIMMVDALSNPLIVSAQATGKIKVYQAVIGSILLLIVPIAYLTLALGSEPESVFVVQLLVVIIAQIVRLIMIRSMICLPLIKYFKKVLIRIILVSVTAPIPPIISYLVLPDVNLLSFIIVCIVCILSTCVSVYYLGLEYSERLFVRNKLNGIMIYLRHRQ